MRKKQEKGNRKAEKQRKKEEKGKENMRTRELKKELESGKALISVAVYKTSSTGGSSTSKVYPTRRAQNENDRPKLPCTSGDVCAVCCGVFVDDVDGITGEIVKEVGGLFVACALIFSIDSRLIIPQL